MWWENSNKKEQEGTREVLIKKSQTQLIDKDKQNSFNCGYFFLEKIYYGLGLNKICEDITKKYHTSQKTFLNLDKNIKEEEKNDLQLFSFLCMLSFDVYIKKQLIEKIIDMQTTKNVTTTEKHTKNSEKHMKNFES